MLHGTRGAATWWSGDSGPGRGDVVGRDSGPGAATGWGGFGPGGGDVVGRIRARVVTWWGGIRTRARRRGGDFFLG